MLLQHFLIPEVNETNVYVVACPTNRRAALIDAGGFDPAVVEFVGQHDLRVETIVITHSHYDHTDALDRYWDEFEPERIVAGASRLGEHATTVLDDGGAFEIGACHAEVRKLPGHTSESIVCIVRDNPDRHDAPTSTIPAVAFSGDALFAGSIGGTSGGDAQRLEIDGIRERIFSLPDETIVCPGHGPMTTVGIEKRANPFF